MLYLVRLVFSLDSSNMKVGEIFGVRKIHHGYIYRQQYIRKTINETCNRPLLLLIIGAAW